VPHVRQSVRGTKMMGEAQRSLCCIDRQMTSTERSEKTSTESANLPRIGVGGYKLQMQHFCVFDDL